MLEEPDSDDETPKDVVDVGVLPPIEIGTDEDSGPEDSPSILNLPGSQLRTDAYVCVPNVIGSGEDQNLDISTSTQTKPKKRQAKKRKVIVEYEWSKEELAVGSQDWPDLVTCQDRPKTPLEYFEYFIDDDVIELLVVHTNQYAAKHNILGNCSTQEMKVFIAILLLSGYVTLPRKIMYWQVNSDSHNALVSEAMSRDRFQYIMSNIHACNNDRLDPTDRFAKIRPLLDMVNERFIDFRPHAQNHSVDETMVPYFGSHGAKQFIRGKPIRFGMKFWCGATSDGYIQWMEPYQGANTCAAKYSDNGMGYGVIMSYVDVLPHTETLKYRIFFDNLFTSISLLSDLKNRNIEATGTIRANRIDKSCKITPVNEVGKSARGTYDYCTDKKTGVCIARWNDNNVVSIATNFDSVTPVKHVNRYSREQKKVISVTQPKVISSYNHHMGGIDRADQNVSLYRCGIRGKKWYFPLLTHIFDVCEQNAWKLYQRNEKKIDHLAFRRSVVCSILESAKGEVYQRRRPNKATTVESRFDGVGHLVCSLPTTEASGKKQQLRCGQCGKRATTKCKKCNAALHVDCFEPFHTRN